MKTGARLENRSAGNSLGQRYTGRPTCSDRKTPSRRTNNGALLVARRTASGATKKLVRSLGLDGKTSDKTKCERKQRPETNGARIQKGKPQREEQHKINPDPARTQNGKMYSTIKYAENRFSFKPGQVSYNHGGHHTLSLN
jgi:hypothetical protein